MPKTRRNVSDTARAITRKAFTGGKLDRAAAQSMNATLLSGAMAARVASGMLAGIADSLAQKPPRRTR
jgi:hypothetical protein